MDIDEGAIGQWPNIACAPGEAVAHKPTDKAHERAVDMVNVNAPNTWYIAHDIAQETSFTADQANERIVAAILREVEAMILEGGAE